MIQGLIGKTSISDNTTPSDHGIADAFTELATEIYGRVGNCNMEGQSHEFPKAGWFEEDHHENESRNLLHIQRSNSPLGHFELIHKQEKEPTGLSSLEVSQSKRIFHGQIEIRFEKDLALRTHGPEILGLDQRSYLCKRPEQHIHDKNFFEECFSPNRIREKSMDSDESLDLQKDNHKNNMDEEFHERMSDVSDLLNLKTLSNTGFLARKEAPYLKQERTSIEKNNQRAFTESIAMQITSKPNKFANLTKKSIGSQQNPLLQNMTEQEEIQNTSKNASLRWEGAKYPTRTQIESEFQEFSSVYNELSSTTNMYLDIGKRRKTGATPTVQHDFTQTHSDSKTKQMKEQGEELKIKCTCKKSKCLKLYCECFAKQGFCGDSCECTDCFNKEEFHELRSHFLKETVDKNPNAFKSKYKTIPDESLTLHIRGCHCKKTGCLKRYCECFLANTKCTALCKCTTCKNGCEHGNRIAVEDHKEKVLRKRKRKTTTFMENFLLKMKAVTHSEPKIGDLKAGASFDQV
jgi:hypothetical protein